MDLLDEASRLGTLALIFCARQNKSEAWKALLSRQRARSPLQCPWECQFQNLCSHICF